MRSIKPLVQLLLLGLPVLATTAGAQSNYAAGLAAGVTVPTGKFSQRYSTGANVTGFIALGVEESPAGIRLDGVYNTFAGRTVTPAAGGAAVENPDLRLWGLVANGLFTTSGSVAKSYILGGVGFYNGKTSAPDARSRNHVGFSIGIGSIFSFGPLASMVEVRFHSISRKPDHGGSIHFIPVAIGFVF